MKRFTDSGDALLAGHRRSRRRRAPPREGPMSARALFLVSSTSPRPVTPKTLALARHLNRSSALQEFLVLLVLHVDEIDDHDPSQGPQPQLSSDLPG